MPPIKASGPVKKGFHVFRELPLSAITPHGWLKKWLEKQRDGLTGHLEVAGYPFGRDGWGTRVHYQGKADSWWPFEQVGYWHDGLVRCGHLLRDKYLLGKFRKVMEFELNHADRDGYVGPSWIKKPESQNRWAHAVYFRALMGWHSGTGDRRIPEALRRHYLSRTSPHSDMREVCNVEPMLWVWDQTGDIRLLEMAVTAYEDFNKRFPRHDTAVNVMLSGRRGSEHGVTYTEMGKLGEIMYLHTGKKKWLKATLNAFAKIEKYSMLVDGVSSSTERLRGKDPLDSHETCDIADYSWACGYLVQATGNARWGDAIERACLNAGPGAVKKDFRAHQYFSCPNQFVATGNSNHNLYEGGGTWMSYRPKPGTECCTGEVNRIMPNYVARMWMARDKGVAAVLYGPSSVKVQAGKSGKTVEVLQETSYPFSDRIMFTVKTSGSVRFPLFLRIPGWCRNARVYLNGLPRKTRLNPGSFARIERIFNNGDTIELFLPAEVKESRWPRGGMALEAGPLVFSLRIPEKWEADKKASNQSRDFPAWNLYPAGAEGFALASGNPAKDSVLVRRPAGEEPWTQEPPPVELMTSVRRLPGWGVRHTSSVKREQYHLVGREWKAKREVLHRGEFLLTPQLPSPKEAVKRASNMVERVALVPYGTTHLRLTVFPRALKKSR